MALEATPEEAGIIASNEGLVRHLAKRYQPAAELDDLMQAGKIGLVRASRSYDPTRGPSLQSYAFNFIRAEMRRAVRRTASVPFAQGRAERKGSRLKPLAPISLDSSASDSDSQTIHEVFGTSATQEDDLASFKRDHILRSAVNRLPEKLREVLLLRLNEDLTFAEIGKRIGCTRQWAQRLVAEATDVLRTRLSRELSSDDV